MNELNALEKCLLIDFLINSKDKPEAGISEERKVDLDNTFAHFLAKRMELEVQNSRSASVDYDNQVFDLVLNLNNLNDA